MLSTRIDVLRAFAGRSLLTLHEASVAASAFPNISAARSRAPLTLYPPARGEDIRKIGLEGSSCIRRASHGQRRTSGCSRR